MFFQFLNGAIDIDFMKFDFEFKISFNSLNGAINIWWNCLTLAWKGTGFNSLNGAINIEWLTLGDYESYGFNSLNGAINIKYKKYFNYAEYGFQFLKWCD